MNSQALGLYWDDAFVVVTERLAVGLLFRFVDIVAGLRDRALEFFMRNGILATI